MTKPATIFDKLAAPFEPKDVEWRVGSTTKDKSKGMALCYVDARAVMDRLDAVCGPAGWQDRYEFDGPRTICYLSVLHDGAWITKADGAGDTAVEAEKGSISSAFKRAAVKWGIGRYLYDVASPWVKLNQFKQIEPSEFDRLRKILPARIEAAEDAPEKPADKPVEPPTEITTASVSVPVPHKNDKPDWAAWLVAVGGAIDGTNDYRECLNLQKECEAARKNLSHIKPALAEKLAARFDARLKQLAGEEAA